jgi:hypothetical protein
MSFKQLFDTQEKMAYWFSALARLSDAVSVSMVISGNPWYSLISIATGVIGREVSGYYKLQIEPKEALKMSLEKKGKA